MVGKRSAAKTVGVVGKGDCIPFSVLAFNCEANLGIFFPFFSFRQDSPCRWLVNVANNN